MGFDTGWVDSKGRRVRQQPQKVRRWRGQGDLKRQLIQRDHTELTGGQLAGQNRLSVGHRREHAGIGRRGLWVDHAPPRPHKIPRGDGLAIAPAPIGVEIKGVGQPVSADVPARRCARNDLTVGGRGGQPLKQINHDVGCRHALPQVGVQCLRLFAVAAVQHLLVGQHFGCGLAFFIKHNLNRLAQRDRPRRGAIGLGRATSHHQAGAQRQGHNLAHLHSSDSHFER